MTTALAFKPPILRTTTIRPTSPLHLHSKYSKCNTTFTTIVSVLPAASTTTTTPTERASIEAPPPPPVTSAAAVHIDIPHLEHLLEVANGDGGNIGPPPSNNDDDGDGDSSPEPSGNNWANPLLMLACGIKGRLAADPFFAHKLFTEMGLDAVIILGVNWAARKERFLPEIEFTACQLAISLLSDFALVYLLAPSTFRQVAKAGSFRAKLATLPCHVFQQSIYTNAPFTVRQRVATFLLKGGQYGAVGYAMGCLGAASVQALIKLREAIDPNFVSPSTVQSVGGTGLAWCGFMATSSNVRYNAVNALEDVLYKRSVGVGKAGSFALRLLNNWAGAAQWVFLTSSLCLDEPWEGRKSSQTGQQNGKASKSRKARK